MVDVAQSVRASDCGSEGRRFEPDLPPLKPRKKPQSSFEAFLFSCFPRDTLGLLRRIYFFCYNMRYSLLIFILIFLSVNSCKTKQSQVERISLFPTILNDSLFTMLPGGNVICKDYFVWQDGFAIDTFMHVVSLRSGEEAGKMGKIGRGAEEFVSPFLIGSIGNNVLVMDDNLSKMAQYAVDSLLSGKNPFHDRLPLPVKQPLYVSLMDSVTFVCLQASCSHPFQIIRNDKIVDQFGKLPLLDSISNPYDIFQGSIIYHQSKDVILYSTNRFPYIALYKRNTDGSFELKKENIYPFHYSIKNNKVKLSPENQDDFRGPTFTKDYIIFRKQDEQYPLPKQERTPGIRDLSKVPHTIYIFDYDLNLIKIADLNMAILNIKSTPESNTLYLIALKDSYCIAKCDIP